MTKTIEYVPNDSWRHEIERYSERLDKLTELRPEYVQTLKEIWPDKIWPNTDDVTDDIQFAAFRLSVFCTTICSQAMSASILTVSLWRAGQLFAVPLNTRFIFESWGAIQYGTQLLSNPNKEKVCRLTENLLVGVYKANVDLPTGGKASAQCPNVIEYIRALNTVNSSAESTYNLLSSASHPNALQNTYFTMMSPPLSSWGRAIFDEHAHKLLDTVLSAHELAFFSMQSDTELVLRRAAEILNLDR